MTRSVRIKPSGERCTRLPLHEHVLEVDILCNLALVWSKPDGAMLPILILLENTLELQSIEDVCEAELDPFALRRD